MRLRQRLTLTVLVALALGALADTARADTLVTANAGRVLGGDLDEGQLSYGAAIGFLGNGPLGFEVDLAYTPDFFGPSELTGKNNQVTLMANLLLSVPVNDSVRVYATGGAGIMKSRVEDVDPFFDVDQNDFGVDLGGGVMLKLGQSFGVRGDVRYFRDVQTRSDDLTKVDFGGLDYWRAVAGVTLRF